MAYRNCTELNKDFPFGVEKGHPAYRPGLDRDKDGVACETDKGSPEPAPRENPEPAEPTPRPSQSTSAVVENGTGTNLPQTGPGEVTAVGAVIVLLGAVIVTVVRRRRIRFTAN